MLATVGDLIDDIVVRFAGPIHVASDTPAKITRRQGGSAATVAVVAAGLGSRARFIGQVGDDTIGAALVEELSSAGVDTAWVRRAGSTGTIIVLVDPTGERSMLTDRRSCVALGDPDARWLDRVTVLHTPLYSLAEPPLSTTATTLIEWAHERGVLVSIDTSSVSVIESTGVDAVRALLVGLRPAVVFANEEEARELRIAGPLGASLTIVKRGPDPALVHRPGGPSLEVPAVPTGGVIDTTGAGDAFAAGFLTYGEGEADGPAWRQDPAAACLRAHSAAHRLLVSH